MRTPAILLLLAFGPGLVACGDDRVERGLTPPDEVAVPMDPAKMKETEQEREDDARDE